MRLDELSKEAQRGSGILVLRQQTATLAEREALSTLIADMTERVVKANNEGYRKGQLALANRSGHFPHGVVTEEDGTRTLYVNEYKVRGIGDANKLRGLMADRVCSFRDWGMPQEVRDYLEQEVLEPLQASIRDAKENPGERKMREAREAHGVPQHESSDWALMVLKRLEAMEVWRKACSTAVIPWPADVLKRLDTIEKNIGEQLQVSASRSTVSKLIERIERLEHGAAGEVAGYQEQNKRIDALEQAGQGSRLLALEASLHKTETANKSHARRLQGLEMSEKQFSDWRSAVSARLNAIEIWKHDELATYLTEKVAAIERLSAEVEQLKAVAHNAASIDFVDRVERISNENQRAINEQNATAYKNAERLARLESQVRI